MIILGLTGSVAMGKSYVASLFRRFHVPVFDADKAVHRLLAAKGGAVGKVAALFPEVIENESVSRQKLARRVFGDRAALSQLEDILHPLVQKAERAFIKRAMLQRKTMVVLEIPLLFETHAEKRCDKVIAASAPFFLQKLRVLKRPGMTQEKLAAILKRQMKDFHKRKKADYLIYTGLGRAVTFRQVQSVIRKENHA